MYHSVSAFQAEKGRKDSEQKWEAALEMSKRERELREELEREVSALRASTRQNGTEETGTELERFQLEVDRLTQKGQTALLTEKNRHTEEIEQLQVCQFAQCFALITD